MSRPIDHNDIIFPSASGNIHGVSSELKRNDLSIKNRLRSIVQDTLFVEDLARRLNLPLVANERCGSWYIRPERKTGSAYFKSTDGHFGQWSFSLRRLNLQLLDVIQQGRGCVIVDSTRRGKSMPDALSKTVPIWIAVLNRLLFPELRQFHALLTPSIVVSESEHSQIEHRIETFVQEAQELTLDIGKLKHVLQKPLEPRWVTPATDLGAEIVTRGRLDSWPVVLCTASSSDSMGKFSDTSYVQGAADDHESWAQGLTAVTFWQHEHALLAITDDLDAEIHRIVHTAEEQVVHRQQTLVERTRGLFIGSNASVLSEHLDIDIVVYCNAQRDPVLEADLAAAKKISIHLACGGGKIGSRQLRTELDKLNAPAASINSDAKILCACPTGRDLAVGVALAILCKHFPEDGKLVAARHCSMPAINKASIRQKLSWIVVSMPDAAPSRATLQSVNAYLMS